MPAFDAYTALIEGIETAIRTAWDPDKIYRGRPFGKIPRADKVAVIELMNFDQSFSGDGGTIHAMGQRPSFMISLLKPVPASTTNLLDEAMTDANALIAELEAATTFAGVMMVPQAAIAIKPDEIQLRQGNDQLETAVEFTGICQSTHHSRR